MVDIISHCVGQVIPGIDRNVAARKGDRKLLVHPLSAEVGESALHNVAPQCSMHDLT